MEATEEITTSKNLPILSYGNYGNTQIKSCAYDSYQTSIKCLAYALRIHGAGNDLDTKCNHEILLLNDIKFFWNSRLCVNFIEKVMHLVNNGVASILHAKGSLLATALDTDPCSAGARGIPLQQLPNIKLVCLQAE